MIDNFKQQAEIVIPYRRRTSSGTVPDILGDFFEETVGGIKIAIFDQTCKFIE